VTFSRLKNIIAFHYTQSTEKNIAISRNNAVFLKSILSETTPCFISRDFWTHYGAYKNGFVAENKLYSRMNWQRLTQFWKKKLFEDCGASKIAHYSVHLYRRLGQLKCRLMAQRRYLAADAAIKNDDTDTDDDDDDAEAM